MSVQYHNVPKYCESVLFKKQVIAFVIRYSLFYDEKKWDFAEHNTVFVSTINA